MAGPDKQSGTGIAALIGKDKARFQRMLTLIGRGVIIEDPFSTHIADNVVIGRGTVIHPFTVIEAGVKIGKKCSIGPFARIREGVVLKNTASIGNFVEVVRSTIAEGSKVKHLTYIGDCRIDRKVNVGAGTVVANYDGRTKHATRIKQGAFIGSGSILVAPLVIGKGAMTGAGSVVTRNRNVPDNTIVVGVPARPLKKKK